MTSFEAKLESLIAPVLEVLGCRLVRVRLIQAKSKVLEIMVERIDEQPVSIEQCREVSNNISAILDAEDVITTKYSLEVCSAGVERPLVRLEDYTRFAGREVLLKLLKAYDGTKKIRGELRGVKDDSVVVGTDNAEEVVVAFEDIRDAHLVLTDELYKQLLKQQVN